MSAELHSHARAADRGMSAEVRALSTRVIDPRAAAKGFVLVALLGAPLLWWLAESLWVGADRATDASRALTHFADPEPPPPVPGSEGGVRPIALLLVDGLRVDEAERLPAMRAFAAGGRHGTLRYPRPTLSTGAYHALVTGTANHLSGVATNRYHRTSNGAVARLDTLADRVRALGGRQRYLAEDLDWLLQLLTPVRADRELHVGRAFDEAAARAFHDFAREATPGLLVAHLLAVDESAHEGGVHSQAHQDALSRADALIAALLEAQRRQPALVALVLADHGHLEVGGHGGDEDEVTHAPFALRGPEGALGAATTPDAELPPECIPRLLSLASGLPTPRSATCTRFDALPGSSLLARAAYAEDAARQTRLVHEVYAVGWLALAMLLALMGLGATKRSFSGLDAGSVLAPLVWLGGVALLHLVVLGRPLTLSAIHLVTPHLFGVGVLGALTGALGIAVGAAVAVFRGRPATDPRLALRRAAGALVWASIVSFALSWARIGGSYSPWPPTAFAAYAPVFLAAAGIGALLVAAATLLATVAKREVSYYERPTADGAPAPGPGDIT
ncbi:MAG: alkaline phosphatase family protein [Sandaracinaceae bacterium]|nr:alkaline phosphatase family protein [Sandaracinaceae bacterium]